jgi:succinate dehydrogenase (ubiquinone) membrane anchor subunit
MELQLLTCHRRGPSRRRYDIRRPLLLPRVEHPCLTFLAVNDPVPVPPAHPSHGSYHWTFERLLAVGLVPLTVAPFAAGTLNPTMDAILCASIVVHSHMGFQAVIIDYIPQRRYPGARKAFMWGLNAATLLVGVGLYEFETNDVGVTEAIKRLWTA